MKTKTKTHRPTVHVTDLRAGALEPMAPVRHVTDLRTGRTIAYRHLTPFHRMQMEFDARSLAVDVQMNMDLARIRAFEGGGFAPASEPLAPWGHIARTSRGA